MIWSWGVKKEPLHGDEKTNTHERKEKGTCSMNFTDPN